jgi:peptide deformylase
MAVLPIIKAPDPILKKRCAPVEIVDDEIRTLMDDMLETMYVAPGVGLAAPQVSVHKRVIVVDTSRGDTDRSPIRMADPEIIEFSEDLAVYDEGCLSFPDQYAEVERPAKVRVRYLDYDNAVQEIEAEGLLSTCIQHEMDHLDGKLFVDHISMLKRNMILRKMTKLKKTEALS